MKLFKSIKHKNNNNLLIIPVVSISDGEYDYGLVFTIIENRNEALIINLGEASPDQYLYGVEYYIHWIEYLKKKKVKGIIITRNNLNHFSLISQVIKDLQYPPIYLPPETYRAIQENERYYNKDFVVMFNSYINLNDSNIHKKPINCDEDIILGDIKITPFLRNHTTRSSFGLNINIGTQNILFKEFLYIWASKKIYQQLTIVSTSKILSEIQPLISFDLLSTLTGIFTNIKKKIVLVNFEVQDPVLARIIEIALKIGFKVSISDSSGIRKTIDDMLKLSLINSSTHKLINSNTIPSSDEPTLILATGIPGEKHTQIIQQTIKDNEIKEYLIIYLGMSYFPN